MKYVYIFRHDACNYERISWRGGVMLYESAGTGRDRKDVSSNEFNAALKQLVATVGL